MKTINHPYIIYDGTFMGSGGALETWYNTISFNGVVYTVEAYTHRLDYTYYVYGKNATEEEYNKAVHEEDTKPPVTWYDYSLENIESHFP